MNTKVNEVDVGNQMYHWAKDLFPITRSITGCGVRETLQYLKNLLPKLIIHAVPSGTPAFDWIVPDEWNIRDAFIADEFGNRIIDFQRHNLHVVGYAEPVDIWLDRDELDKHLYSLPDQPHAIPYITSYYSRRWGFCLSHHQRQTLPTGLYHAVIDSEIKPGVLNYGELILQGREDKEIFISTYICHPSLANNELSGPVVATALAQWLTNFEDRRYTYRIIFIPETIGSIVYLSRHLPYLKSHVIAGFNISCIGDDRCYSYLPSRNANTLADQAALHVLAHLAPNFKSYTFLDRGSDERQYCAPGVDLPIASIMRSKYGEYPEYHTSDDDLTLITPAGLAGGYMALHHAIEVLERNGRLKPVILCEPQLGKRGLYPTLGTKHMEKQVTMMLNLLAYCDGQLTLLEVANQIGEPFWELLPIVNKLISHDLLVDIDGVF